jgi:hypothetical protein
MSHKESVWLLAIDAHQEHDPAPENTVTLV